MVLNFEEQDVVAEVKRLTDGGADVAIEALGQAQTFENGLRCTRPGGTLSSLGDSPLKGWGGEAVAP